MTITKRELVLKIAEITGHIQSDVKNITQTFIDVLTEELSNGNRVELRNFGVFNVRKRKSRIGRNPNKPEVVIQVPAKYVADFKPGEHLKRKMIKNLGVPKK